MKDLELDKLTELSDVTPVNFQNELYYPVVKILSGLTDTKNPKIYLANLLSRDAELGNIWKDITLSLPIMKEGKLKNMDCVNMEGVYRLIQSIPSEKANSLKVKLVKHFGEEEKEELTDFNKGLKMLLGKPDKGTKS